MNKAARSVVVSLLVGLIMVVLLSTMAGQGLTLGTSKVENLSYSQFVQKVEAGEVSSGTWSGEEIRGKLKTGTDYIAQVGVQRDSQAGGELLKSVQGKIEEFKLPKPGPEAAIGQVLLWILPIVLIIGFMYFMFLRPAQQGGNQAMNFGRSRAKRMSDSGPKITFDDVAGIDEAKAELTEIVDFLRNTKKYVAMGAKIPKGILLTGPPGVGKTHLARAIAGEAGVPFYHISGSDFVEMFVGVGAARVRDLFETAKAHRPCLIFVDEIDAVGRQRGSGLGGGHDEREQTLNQLLVEMDGFDPNQGVIMIAATNRPDVLDPALLRPGRFDRQVVVDAPGADGRAAILKIHGKGKPFDATVDFQKIAKRTPGFTGADLANALNESALLAARRNKLKISSDEIEEALDRVMLGPARHSLVMTQKERETTAYHEAGHAIVGEMLENCDPIHKVTILPRGMALGVTWSMPDVEKHSRSKADLLDRIAMALGGRAAEEVVYNQQWTGVTGDLERVTQIARAMVCKFGMSEKLGTLSYGTQSENPFLGRGSFEGRDYSEEVAKMIDDEVRSIVEAQHQRAIDILNQHREQMDAVVKALLENETIEREEFLRLMGLEDRIPVKDEPENTSPGSPVESESTPETSANPNPGAIPPRLEPGTA